MDTDTNLTKEFNQNNDHKRAYLLAIRLLTRKDYSKHKLKTKLIDKGYEESLVEQLIEELVEKKYLREDYYAEARIKGLMHKGYSIFYIKNKLEQEEVFVDSQTIRSVFSEYKISESDQIANLVAKKLPQSVNQGPIDYKVKVRIIRFLNSKGHKVTNIDQYLSDNT